MMRHMVTLQGHYNPDKQTKMIYYPDITGHMGYGMWRVFVRVCQRAGMIEGDYMEIAPGQDVQVIEVMRFNHPEPVQILYQN